MTTEVDTTHVHRAERQTWVGVWAERLFAAGSRNRRIRALRFLEEAMELGQTQGLTFDDVVRQAQWTYGRPVGDVKQEIGGVTVSLYALAENLGVSVDGCEADELLRVKTIDPAKIQAKEAAKIAAGLL